MLDHSMLLEQGVLLSEPSTRLEGMAGESLAVAELDRGAAEELRGGDPPGARPRNSGCMSSATPIDAPKEAMKGG